MRKFIKKYFIEKIGFLVSNDGFIITKTLFAKFACNILCVKKIVVNLGEIFYIINK